ncbi:MAG: DUF1330 domain-containing protein [Polyangiaceae bacterium]|nr:DUF1330 domain-containing protein [Polyangiaceae bacterium]
MLYLTQLVYVHPGKEAEFHAFEAVAIPLIEKYNGELLLRLRPTPDTLVEGTSELPYEVHFVRFDSDQDFARFAADESRKQFLHLKEASVRATLLVRGAAV